MTDADTAPTPDALPRWEYLVTHYSGDEFSALNLSIVGADGWEMVNTLYLGRSSSGERSYEAVFKRLAQGEPHAPVVAPRTPQLSEATLRRIREMQAQNPELFTALFAPQSGLAEFMQQNPDVVAVGRAGLSEEALRGLREKYPQHADMLSGQKLQALMKKLLESYPEILHGLADPRDAARIRAWAEERNLKARRPS